MDFEKRLEEAILRGKNRGSAHARAELARALSEEELKRLHTQYRLELSEHIERCLQQLQHHVLGLRYETIFGDRGWGAAVFRDELRVREGRRQNEYTRLELTILPWSASQVLELSGKATIRNKEIFRRSFFEHLAEAESAKFAKLIDIWVLEFAEQEAARDGT